MGLTLAAALLLVTAGAIGGRASASWTYAGCYYDDVNNRILMHPSYTDYDIQTVETCTSYCAANNFAVAGVEYSSECYCDYALPAGVTKEPETDCSMTCAGNSSETCGGPNRLSVYTTGAAISGPSTNPGPNGWTFVSCYTDSVNARTLNTAQDVAAGASGMSVSQCTAACKLGGYSYAGLEYGQQCFCDSTIRSTGSKATGGCDMLCAGNGSEYCGGSDRLNIYQTTVSSPPSTGSGGIPSGWTAMGCWTDNGANRTLATQQSVQGGSSNMTIENCLAVCTSNGFTIGGTEYSQECWCGSSILNAATCASDQTTCYMPCKGNNAETCGGPDRLNLYISGSSPLLTACSAVSSSTSTSSVSGTSKGSTSSTTISISTSSVSSLTSTSSISTSTSSSSAPTTTSTTSSLTSSTVTPSTSSTSSPASITPTTTSSSTLSTSTLSTGTSCATTKPTSTACPTFWTNIIADLAPLMRDTDGNCTDLARGAIRYAFHDAAAYSTKTPFYCPAAGGADGSLLLSSTEINRTPDNDGLAPFHANLTAKYNAYKALGYAVGAADLIQVAGALGVKACPGGQFGRVYVGRQDTTTAAPPNLLPVAFGPGADHDTILALFTDKGFSARDLAALIGAHTTSKANFQTAEGIPVGTPQDTTPGQWDVLYYNETLYSPAANGGGYGRFESDINLSKNASSAVGKQFQSFVGAQAAWGASFSSAFQFMSTLGVPRNVKANLVDCTDVITGTVFAS
ncbi:fungal class II heme-containing peroxidase [Recurvomyces mirabilis]|uniref:Fungal class II heme-containing peroxidase n=1 Tax=Recurvomyces mirabilis TaxID=574656 RepID=A0AAE0TT54_9PEZI|nr:fungal class II heme-containing peroxidase [Recurvomyces mirabilis]KAK5155379.1 hypothetical protein LTS14_005640 [Recurvomyces mirabilis]